MRNVRAAAALALVDDPQTVVDEGEAAWSAWPETYEFTRTGTHNVRLLPYEGAAPENSVCRNVDMFTGSALPMGDICLIAHGDYLVVANTVSYHESQFVERSEFDQIVQAQLDKLG